MAFWDSWFGSGPSEQMEVIESPWSPFQNQMADYLSNMLETGAWKPQPTQGMHLLRQGLNPAMKNYGRLTRAYANSPAPYIMGQAAGTLGQFMTPDLDFDPNNRLGGMFEGNEITNMFSDMEGFRPDNMS